jgi:carboxylesterase
LSNADGPRPDPAREYDDALRRFAALRARDGPEISSAGRSRLYAHGRRTPRAVVFIHGFTNCPQQWDLFSLQMHAAGDSIVVPRLPGHGHFYRATHALAGVKAAALLATVSEAVDIACGLGERVALAGLSIGGTIAPRVALSRDDIAHTVAIVPFFAVRRFDVKMTRILSAVLETIPNFFVAWDPSGGGRQVPSYGYPKFATRMLAESLRIGLDVEAASHARAPAGRTTFLLNAHEPACNNAVTVAVHDGFERSRAGSTELVVLSDLPANHDIIDPTNPNARIDLVYPALRAILS